MSATNSIEKSVHNSVWQGSLKLVNVRRARNWAWMYVAEARLKNMMKWWASITAFGLGNPVLYLFSVGIGIGALVNAAWLLVGLLRRGSYTPEPGWRRFLLQILIGCILLAMFLVWASSHFDWIAMRAERYTRIGMLVAVMVASALIYGLSLWASGMKLRQLVRR